MKFELNSLPRGCSDEDILAEIRRVDIIVNKDFLTRKDYDEYGKMSSSAIQKRLGDWGRVLDSAGLGHKYSGRIVSEKVRRQNKNITDEEILDELREIATKLAKNYLSQEEVNANSEIISASTVIYRFGSFLNGLKQAELSISPMGKRFSEDKYYENLLNVWTHHGRQPYLREMDEFPSIISSSGYESRFKKWRNALESFIKRMNQENEETDSKEFLLSSEKSSEVIREKITKSVELSEDRREVKLGLRFKVFSRDKFKCVKCGNSPATDYTCKLHADHVVPFSKSGKTILENLQTLCEKCNLGKGNRHME